jgi:hypothetical protein
MSLSLNYVIKPNFIGTADRLCGLMVRAPGCRTRGLWNGAHSALVRINEELRERKSSGSDLEN